MNKIFPWLQQVCSLVEKTDVELGNTKQCRTFGDRCKGLWKNGPREQRLS